MIGVLIYAWFLLGPFTLAAYLADRKTGPDLFYADTRDGGR